MSCGCPATPCSVDTQGCLCISGYADHTARYLGGVFLQGHSSVHFSSMLPEDTEGRVCALARRQGIWATECTLGVLAGMGRVVLTGWGSSGCVFLWAFGSRLQVFRAEDSIEHGMC